MRACSTASSASASASAASVEARGGERRGELRAGEPALGGPVEAGRRQQRLGGHVDDHRADRQVRGLQLRDGVGGLLDRHVLEQGHQVDGGLRRAQHRHDAVALGLDRARAGQLAHLAGDPEEAGDPPGRRSVDDDGVVDRPAVVPAGHRFLDLAGEQHVADAGSDRRGEVDGAHLAQRPAGPAQVVEQVEVLEEGLLEVDRQRLDLPAAAGDGDAALLVGQRGRVEQLGDALPALGLDQQDRAAVGGQREGQGGGDRGLAGTALAGHHVQAHAAVHGRGGAHPHQRRSSDRGRPASRSALASTAMTEPARRRWEYATIPLLIHNTKAILDSWGVDGWELVTVLPGPDGCRPARGLPQAPGRLTRR